MGELLSKIRKLEKTVIQKSEKGIREGTGTREDWEGTGTREDWEEESQRRSEEVEEGGRWSVRG
jgi:hypothetical protein